MRVFFDTNVLLSGYLWAGTSAAVIRRVSVEHDRVSAEFVIREATRTLAEKFDVPEDVIAEFEAELRTYPVEPLPAAPAPVSLADPDDAWVLASALAAGVDVLVTGDKHLLAVRESVPGVRILTPREIWEELERSRPLP